MLQWSGEAILDNAQFDLVIATAIGLGLAFDRAGQTAFGRRYGETAARAVITLVVAARLVATLRIEPALVLFDPGYRAQYYANADAARQDAARIARIPGPVACDFKVVCRLAGKPFSYDDFRAEMLVASGASHGLDEKGLMRAHGLTHVRNDDRGGIAVLFRSLAGPALKSAANRRARGRTPATESVECPWIAGRLRGNVRPRPRDVLIGSEEPVGKPPGENREESDMHPKRFYLSTVAAIGLAALLAPVQASAQTAVAIDNDDIGGVVTRTERPRGRRMGHRGDQRSRRPGSRAAWSPTTRAATWCPDLPKGKYKVWVRGYGLVDSPKVDSEPGKQLNLTAVPPPTRPRRRNTIRRSTGIRC